MKVSVCMVTYNHADFIGKAIESVLTQNTEDFTIELVIGEDNSKDATRQICVDFKKKYPNKVKLLLHESNLGPVPNFVETLSQCDGDFIALCEGDDMWSDENKLRKQVAFLNENSDYIMCGHNATVTYEKGLNPPHPFNEKILTEEVTINDIFDNWFIPTASIIFKRNALKNLPEWFPYIYHEDYALQLLLADKGKVQYMNEELCIYRKNFSALSYKTSISFNYKKLIELFIKLNEYFDYKYNRIISQKVLVFQERLLAAKRKEATKFFSPFFIFNSLMNPFNRIMVRNRSGEIKIIRY